MTGGGEHQGSFTFAGQPGYARGDFLIAPCNAPAADWIDRWPEWPGKIKGLVITGPASCGKTHLGEIWRKASGAAVLGAIDVASLAAAGDNPHILLDHPAPESPGWPEEIFFHLLNRIADAGGSVLILTREPMAQQAWGLADLASRLRGMMAVEIGDPDDAVLIAMMQKIADDLGLALADDVLRYIASRIERSFAAAHSAIGVINTISLERKKKAGMALVREALDRLEPRLL